MQFTNRKKNYNIFCELMRVFRGVYPSNIILLYENFNISDYTSRKNIFLTTIISDCLFILESVLLRGVLRLHYLLFYLQRVQQKKFQSE